MTSVAVDAAARAWGQRRVRLGLPIEVEPHGQHHARAAVAEDDLGRLARVHGTQHRQVESRVTQEEIKKEPEKPIDREKTCPLLLRVFTTNNGRHHRMDEFSRGNVPSSELQIYTWMDATLKELTSLVKEVYPEARKKGTHFNFAIVFTDLKRPGYRVKEIGSTMSGRKGTDDSMTLQSQKFQIGDYLDIAITPPNRAPPSSGRMRPY